MWCHNGRNTGKTNNNINERMTMLLTRYAKPQCGEWDSFSTLRQFQNDVERLFGPGTPAERSWSPTLEVVEGQDQFVVAVELPGIKATDVKVTVEDDVLTIAGERKYEVPTASELRLSERVYGKFERSVRLSAPVLVDRITATSKDGVLTIALPKTEQAKPREIKVATA